MATVIAIAAILLRLVHTKVRTGDRDRRDLRGGLAARDTFVGAEGARQRLEALAARFWAKGGGNTIKIDENPNLTTQIASNPRKTA